MEFNKDQLVHDLRNPLNTISVNAELGKLLLQKTGDIKKAIEIFEVVLAECHRAARLVDGLESASIYASHEEPKD